MHTERASSAPPYAVRSCTRRASTWRRQRDEGSLKGLGPKKRGRQPSKNRKSKRVAQLEGEVRRLRKKLEQAETIIEIPKKLPRS